AGPRPGQGFRPGEPVVWFGNWGGHIPVGWYLTSGRVGESETQLVGARPTRGKCTAVEVVTRTDEGRAWLAAHHKALVARTSFPSFGDAVQGSHISDVIVARLRWRRGILDRPPGSTNRALFRIAGTPTPCVRSAS